MYARRPQTTNGHFACMCYHPLFVFNEFGDLERCTLRSGNVHSPDGWRDVRGGALPAQDEAPLLRGIAAFANPLIYEFLEAEGFK